MSEANTAVEQANNGIRLPYQRQLAILLILSKGNEKGINYQAIFKSLSRASAGAHEEKKWAAAAVDITSKKVSVVLSNTGFFSLDVKLMLDVFEDDAALPAAIEYLKVVCPRADRGAYNYD
jgi:hypothetical protein